MTGVEGASEYTRTTPLCSKQSGTGGCSKSEGTWWAGGPLRFGSYDLDSTQSKRSRTCWRLHANHRLGRTEIHAAGLDEEGHLVNASYQEYLIPSAMEVPELVIGHQETPSPYTVQASRAEGKGGA